MNSKRKMRKFVRQWRNRYPFQSPWVDDRANKQCRRSEAEWFAQFKGAPILKRRDVFSLIEWQFADQPERKEWSLLTVAGIAEWGHARRCIKKALATSNPIESLDFLLGERGGIPGWGPEMASVVLAACRPNSYAVADARGLHTLRATNLLPQSPSEEFCRDDWWPYLRACRKLAKLSGLTLHEISQSLRAAATDAPRLPSSQKVRKSRKKH